MKVYSVENGNKTEINKRVIEIKRFSYFFIKELIFLSLCPDEILNEN
jgi:hypothetical protein